MNKMPLKNTIKSLAGNATKPINRVALVTGLLAEPALRQVVDELTAKSQVAFEVVVLKIQVAALMTTDWVLRKLALPEGVAFDRIILPGYCSGSLDALAEKWGIAVERGPRSVHDLPEYFGQANVKKYGYGQQNIDIIAEINHASQLDHKSILEQAKQYIAAGADLIDIGCEPQAGRAAWRGVGDVVKLLKDQGFRVSVDSFHLDEIAIACKAGAELVLSVNQTNREAACDWGVEVVVIPDDIQTLGGLDQTLELLDTKQVAYRIDPIVEPIGFGFAQSLGRYLQVRERYPKAAMMMGVGNLSEMTEVDSAGVNMLLIGFCQEVGVTSVLTTQVINWARSSVAEIDLARQIMHFAVAQQVPPKHLDHRLVMLRDPKLRTTTASMLSRLAKSLTDNNVRLFADAQDQQLHAMKKNVYVSSDDPFELFDQLEIDDPSHAFYLGYEMAKAMTAMTVHKNYVQDEPLRWGLVERDEVSHFERHARLRKKNATPQSDGQL